MSTRAVVIEFEDDWGIEAYSVGDSPEVGMLYGVRHKHDDGWKMALCLSGGGGSKVCSCGAVAPNAILGLLEMCRWR